METTVKTCEGCDKPLHPLDLAQHWTVCMDCTKARHRAVMARKCVCGRKRRENPKLNRVGSRTWKTCNRCLMSTGNLS